MTFRCDFGRLDGKARTPQGGLRAPAYLTRTGVLLYRNEDGSVRRELRHPEEVFHPDSLATLDGAPVTVGHPGVVKQDNWKSLSVGHVHDGSKQEGIYVKSKVSVQDGNTVAGIERGDLIEVSCGYECQIDNTPGEYEGERYDAIQRNIRYNHVGLGPKDWGRAGNAVSLKLDSAAGGEGVRFDGLTYNPDTLGGDLNMDFEKLYNEAKAALATEKARADKAEGERDTHKERADKAEADLTAERDPKRVDGLVQARCALVDAARSVLGADYKADGKSDREVRIETITKVKPDFKADGKSDDYVTARFDSVVESAAKADGSLAVVAAASAPPKAGEAPATKKDSEDEDPEVRMQRRNQNAWKGKSK